MQFCFIILLIIAYFIWMFTLAKQYINNIEIISHELSTASYNEASLEFIQNVQRETFYNASKPIFNGNGFNYSQAYLTRMNNEFQKYFDSH